jgi:hypothetical protein
VVKCKFKNKESETLIQKFLVFANQGDALFEQVSNQYGNVFGGLN